MEKEKNLCGKTRNVDNPYEVWEGVTGWTWKILKKYQRPGLEAKNPAARWYCAVTSPYTPDEDCEYGDVYVREIKSQATRRL